MLDKFHDIIGGIHVPVDDGVDKLNRKYTLLVFLFLALPIFTKQYIGDPIECFAPVYFAEHQSRYINSYCWTQSTYYMVPVGDPDDDGDQQEPPDRIMPDEVDYFIGFETVTHVGNEKVRRVRVSYYQWAPLILLAQGLCFYIPFLIWNSCANNAGVKLRRLLKKASDIASLPPGCQQREALLAEFVDQFHTLVTGEAGWCADLQCGGVGGGAAGGLLGGGGGGGGAGSSGNSSASSASSNQANGQTGGRTGGGRGGANANADLENSHHNRRGGGGGGGDRDAQTGGCCLVSIPIVGSLLACCLKPCTSLGLVVGPSKYLCLLYLAVKFAYVFNVALQFFLLGKFLGRGYLRHGLELINRLLINGEWWASPRFPLSTLCQVRADMSGGLRTYTCQCVLPINVFNEKIFSVVWFYMAFLMPLNVLSLLFWMYRTLETNRMSYIRLCLWRTRLVELNQIHRTVRRLSQSYLGYDGVFLLRLIEHNHGSIMATLIMSRLWEFYANQIKLQEDANQMALASNAQHTLSNTTTALSNQYHQFLTNQPFSGGGGNGGAGSGGATGGGHHAPGPPTVQQQPGHAHGPGAGGHHHHGPPPPQPMSHAQQHHAHHHHSHGGGGGGGHSHGPGGHSHPPPPGPNLPHFVGGGHPPLQPTQVGGPGAHPPPPQLGAHGHHSGQISQAPGHHPLHAANTAAAAAHHVHHVAQLAAAAAAAQGASAGGPHLSGAFTGAATHNLLAQLQQQHHANSTQTTHNLNNNTNQQPPGNVAAAVAALAAAAAATSTTNSQPGSTSNSSQQQLQQQQQQQVTTSAGGPCAAASGPIHLQAMKQKVLANGQQPGTGNVQATNSVNAPGQQQQQQPAAAGTKAHTTSSATTSFINASSSSGGGGGSGPPPSSAAGPPLPPPPPAHVVAAVAAGVVPVGARAPTTVTTPTQSQTRSQAAAAAPLAATTRLLAMTAQQTTTQRQQQQQPK